MARYCFIAATGHRGVFVPPTIIVWPTRKGSVLDSFIFINMAVVGWISLENVTSAGIRWESVLKFELHVSSPSLRKPKNANVIAAQNIIVS